MQLRERDTELETLSAAVEAARTGRGATVLVSGEAGIGKTSLLQAFAQGAVAHARVYKGSCEDLMTPPPLGPFRDMVRDAGGPLAGSVGHRPDRDELIDALLAEMSFRQRPAVVIVEDAHWADDASLDVIRYLGRRVGDLPALLVVSYRDEALGEDHPLRRVLGAISGPATRRLPLTGLSDGTVREMAGAAGLDVEAVVAAVGGNPFFLTELLAAPETAIPASIRQAVLGRLASLPKPCRTAVQDLSVVPTELPPEVLPELLDDPAVLESAEQAGVLVVTDGRTRFRHELARRVVEQSLSDARRRAAHQRALAALASADAEPSRLVHQAVGARDAGAIRRYAELAAAEAVASEGHREAAAFARIALEHTDGRSPRADARLHAAAADALHALNRFGEAARHAEHAVQLWDTVGAAGVELGEALLTSARMSTLLADPTAARAQVRRARTILEPLGPSRALAMCYGLVGAQDARQARFESALHWSARSLDVARRVGGEDIVAHALVYQGVARVALGEDAGFTDLQAAVEAAERLDHGDLLTVATHNLAVVLIRAGRVHQAKAYLDLGARAAREHGLDMASFRIEAQLCHVLVLRGRWDEAARRLRALLDSAGDPGANEVNPLAFLGRILARRGEPGAVELIDRAWTLATATGEDQKMAVAAGARIERFWLAGDDAAVREVGTELLTLSVRVGHRYLRGEVLRYLRRAGATAASFPGCPAPFAAGIAGDCAAAAALWHEAGNPYEEALELVAAPGPDSVSHGLAILDRLGAAATAARVRRDLRRVGVPVSRGPRASTRSNPGRLTNRQLDVLALVAEGRTNAEIAAQLVLSSRTVDNHVAALLKRLGVASRQDAAAAAETAGILPARREKT